MVEPGLERIPSLPPAAAAALRREGIETVRDLVLADPARVETVCQASRRVVAQWLAEAEDVLASEASEELAQGEEEAGPSAAAEPRPSPAPPAPEEPPKTFAAWVRAGGEGEAPAEASPRARRSYRWWIVGGGILLGLIAIGSMLPDDLHDGKPIFVKVSSTVSVNTYEPFHILVRTWQGDQGGRGVGTAGGVLAGALGSGLSRSAEGEVPCIGLSGRVWLSVDIESDRTGEKVSFGRWIERCGSRVDIEVTDGRSGEPYALRIRER